jgi:hypothetical protein
MDQMVRQVMASGRTDVALNAAARSGLNEIIRELLQSGVDANAADAQGCTPLMHAATGGNALAIKLLIDAGADIDARDLQKGFTPLICLVAAMHSEKGYLKVARLLIDAGADPNAKANNGTTALDWAMDGRPEKLVQMLRAAGAEAGTVGLPPAEINLDAFDMVIRRTASGLSAESALGAVPLPDPEQLKEAAIERGLQAGYIDEEAASLIRQCDLSFQTAPGKDMTERLIQLVIAAPHAVYDILKNEADPVTQNVLSAMIEACPDLGCHRLVRKTRRRHNPER